jgi:hypothetical protein
MRKTFIECSTRAAALRACPWACATVKVAGGLVFRECHRRAHMAQPKIIGD